MKKLLIAACIVLGVNAASHAQGRGQQRSPQDQAAQLKTSLSLTDDQTTKITAILTAQGKSMDSLRTAGADRTAMQPVRQKYTAQIKAVLTPDQATAYDKQMQARMGGGRGGNGGGNGGGTPPPSNR